MSYVPLFQESEPSAFWMLVRCVMANRTGGARAVVVFREMRRRWPNPASVACARVSELREVIRPLGLSDSRSQSIVSLAKLWVLHKRPRSATASEVMCWPGCGQYAADSWAIFVEKRRDVNPTDKRLREFLAHEAEAAAA